MRSVPQPTKLQFNSGSRHLICVENEEAMKTLYIRLDELDRHPQNLQILQVGVTENKRDLDIEQFDSVEKLKVRLTEIFDRAYMGMRFYAIGSEQFVWQLRGFARSFGLSEEEISSEVVGSKARNIYCSNCQTINPQVRTNITTCSSCGIKLEVQEHFSRLKNAYLGICADAENPGELPEVVEVF
ncbi:dimethylamine monooxygenase subunit DmmA family protein [Myxosarcina sp. GI1]|uniref:dimethylamine monooxygenase subunit DmmA family protein n=1 Tax=Myxosarcina sp. GI1 TaxID=1541065 RepID=UPI00068BD2D3|nr:dimethylamine monooxygenase subunit DmmA family protein [Myxosarcina sp. GI1]